jgi:hypothetical protein
MCWCWKRWDRRSFEELDEYWVMKTQTVCRWDQFNGVVCSFSWSGRATYWIFVFGVRRPALLGCLPHCYRRGFVCRGIQLRTGRVEPI